MCKTYFDQSWVYFRSCQLGDNEKLIMYQWLSHLDELSSLDLGLPIRRVQWHVRYSRLSAVSSWQGLWQSRHVISSRLRERTILTRGSHHMHTMPDWIQVHRRKRRSCRLCVWFYDSYYRYDGDICMSTQLRVLVMKYFGLHSRHSDRFGCWGSRSISVSATILWTRK